MPRSLFLSLFFFLLLPQLIFSQNDCPPRLPLPPSIQSRIVGGHPASAHLIPYLVALQSYDPMLSSWFTFCTATLLSSQWAISAAHCNISPSHRALLLANNTLFGLDHLPTNGSFASNIRRVFVHPNYTIREPNGPAYDIAVFELENPAPSNVKHMRVNINPQIPEERSFVRVLGFGVQSENAPTVLERTLDQVDVPVTKTTDCQEAYSVIDSLRIDPSRHVCAGYTAGGCDSCQGDSGGPMIQYDEKSEPVLVGLVSSGIGCARPDFPGIYVRTAAFESWLDSEMGETGYVKTNSTVAVYQEGWSKGRIITAAVAGAFGLAIGVVVAVVVVVLMRRGG